MNRLPFQRPSAAPSTRRSILDDERFVRGLTIGALIGAAIAGSTLWTRLRRATTPDREAGTARD
ncbi:MAG TPA: hypothetical protein VKR30_08720 [Candidatus Limnocylindrales bacterium]|nr:hypothetical protein [Candidatus Limnocylindrales bacterium]